MTNKLLRTTSIFSSMTLVSRLVGFLRDSIAAQIFGTGAAIDAFYTAFKIPNLMRSLFIEGSFSQVFIPVLSEYRETRTHQEVQRFLSHIAAALACSALIITFLGMSGASSCIRVIAPGLNPEQLHLASEFLRIMFPYLLLGSLAALGCAVMNCYGLFLGAAFTPVWLNICLLGAAWGLSSYFEIPIRALAWGVLLAGVVQFLFTLPFLKHLKLLTFPRLNWKDAGVRKVMILMFPALLGASADQMGIILNNIFASFLPVGSVSRLYYANRLIYFPLSIVGISLATAILPALAKAYAAKTSHTFRQVLGWGIRCNLLIGFPMAITLGGLAGPLVTTLYGYGKFTFFDVTQTQYALLGFSFGLPAFMLIKAISSAFYAQQDIWTPVKILLLVLCINSAINLVLFKYDVLTQTTITIASSISAWSQVSLLLLALSRSTSMKNLESVGGWKRWITCLLVSNGLLAGFFYYVCPALSEWWLWTWYYRMLFLTSLLGAGLILYGFSLRLSGFKQRDISWT